MAFVKLDTGILNSTLWVERECREVFITALLMAHPRELLEPMPQYAIGSLEKTGFIVPAGWFGFVPAAGPGIVRMAMCDPDLGMAALRRLGDPDSESRTPDYDGRRLVRVDGGFIILNFIKYREKDSTTKARSARYRERQRLLTSRRDTITSRRDAPVIVTPRHQAEAEAEAEEILNHDPATQDSDRPMADPKALPAKKVQLPDCPHQEVLQLWAEVLPSMPQHNPSMWKGTRADHLRARWRETAVEKGWTTQEQGLSYLRKLFGYVGASHFLTGRVAGDRPFQAELAWLVNPQNWAKTIEGKYHPQKEHA